MANCRWCHLVEDDQQALAHRELSGGGRPAPRPARCGSPGTRGSGRRSPCARSPSGPDATTGRRRATGGPRGPEDPRDVRHLSHGRSSGSHGEGRRGWPAAPKPSANTKWRRVSTNDHRRPPGLVQQTRVETASTSDGAIPEPLDDAPGFSESRQGRLGASWPGRGDAGQLRVDEGRDVDTVDQKVLDLAVDPDIDQVDAAHHCPTSGRRRGTGRGRGRRRGTRHQSGRRARSASYAGRPREVGHGWTLAAAAAKPPRSASKRHTAHGSVSQHLLWLGADPTAGASGGDEPDSPVGPAGTRVSRTRIRADAT